MEYIVTLTRWHFVYICHNFSNANWEMDMSAC